MIGIYENEKGSGVVYSYDDLWCKTFAPMMEEKVVILQGVKGRTYAERKEYVRNLAIAFSNMAVTMSWYDVANIQSWFREYGKRYGLLREFEENCIC